MEECQQFGPMQFSQLVSAAKAGKLDPQTTIVWRQGMTDWVIASEVCGLFPDAASVTGSLTNALNKLGRSDALLIAFTILVLLQLVVHMSWWMTYSSEADETFITLLSGAASVLAKAVFIIWLFDSWRELPRELRPQTPEAIVGYLFIPFFNLYWIFPAVVGMSKSLQRGLHVDSQADSPMTGIGLGIAFAITSLPSLLLLDLLHPIPASLPLVLGLIWMYVTDRAKRKLLTSKS